MKKIDFFRKKFFGQNDQALVPLQDQSWEYYIEQFYRNEVEKNDRCYIKDEYMATIISMVAQWITGEFASCLITGNIGIGKTTLLKVIFRLFEILRDPVNIPPLRCRPILFVDSSELCRKYVVSEDVRYELCNCKILLIDDIGCEQDTYFSYGNKLDPIKDVIMSRYVSRLPTVIATNLTLQEFAERYGNRVADRVNELYAILECPRHESFRRILRVI